MTLFFNLNINIQYLFYKEYIYIYISYLLCNFFLHICRLIHPVKMLTGLLVFLVISFVFIYLYMEGSIGSHLWKRYTGVGVIFTTLVGYLLMYTLGCIIVASLGIMLPLCGKWQLDIVPIQLIGINFITMHLEVFELYTFCVYSDFCARVTEIEKYKEQNCQQNGGYWL